MEENLTNLVNECKEFIRLKTNNRMSSFLPQGSPAYLVSRDWLKKYKEYILIKDVKRHKKPEVQETHFKEKHPGKMTNVEDLCDTSEKNLIGSGEPPFESSVTDTYLKSDLYERKDFKVYNEDLWKFLFSKYGGSQIKRIYEKHGGYYT